MTPFTAPGLCLTSISVAYAHQNPAERGWTGPQNFDPLAINEALAQVFKHSMGAWNGINLPQLLRHSFSTLVPGVSVTQNKIEQSRCEKLQCFKDFLATTNSFPPKVNQCKKW
jgi:hypothetical protein